MSKSNSKDVGKWYLFPDLLEGNRFLGYFTKDDITQIRGGFPVAQNILFTASKTPTVRPGSKLVGTPISSQYAVKRAWVFETREGIQIEMKTYGDGIYFMIDGVMNDYQLLEGSYTPNQDFCYAIISKPDSIYSRCNWCNGKEAWRYWTGIYGILKAYDNTAHTITLDRDLSTPASLVSGTNVYTTVASWAIITNGSFRITIDGIARNVDGINFAGVTSLSDVATKIQTALRAQTGKLETVEYLTNSNQFKITTEDSTASAITVTTTSTGTVGTDISGAGIGIAYMDCDAGNGVVTPRATNTFTSNGSIVINGIKYYYTGVNGKTLTGVSDMGTLTIDSVVVQAPVIMSSASVLKSSVCGVFDGRIHARNEAKKSVSLYSRLGDPDDWAPGSTDGSGGAKEIEQGGPVTAYANDEEKVYIFKNKSITTLKYISSSDKIDVPKYTLIKPANDKSTTVGAIGQKSTFASPNGVIFVTTDKQLIHLKREQFLDYPQQANLAANIRPTFEAGTHDTDSAGIVYKSKVFYAYKQDSTFNNTVIVHDLVTNLWSAPFVGWNVSDWTVVNGKLRWHSSVSPDTFELIDDRIDNEQSFGTVLRSWNETFGTPELQKKCGYALIEIYMKENSVIPATILYDENGYAGQDEFILLGSEKRFQVGGSKYNPFGASAFGDERFGSNADVSGMTKYRFILELKDNIEFYNIALQLSTDTVNCDYELIRFGYYVTTLYPLIDVQKLLAPNNYKDNLNLQ